MDHPLVSDGRQASTMSAFTAAKALLKRSHEEQQDEEDDAGEDQSISSNGDEESIAAEKHDRPYVQLSTWAPENRELSSFGAEDAVTIRMKHRERVTFLGVYDIAVEHGAVETYGATLCQSSGKHRIFASVASALPDIACKTRECTVSIRSCRNDVSHLGRLSAFFSNIFSEGALGVSNAEAASSKRRSFCLLQSSHDMESNASVWPLRCPRAWLSTFEKLRFSNSNDARPARIFVCGTQKAGKSTFCRSLINHFVTANALSQLQQEQDQKSQTPDVHFKTTLLLDLDPGQPELSVPGQITLAQIATPLLGPPFTHPCASNSRSIRILRTHCIANASPQDDPEYFMQCVLDLVRSSKKYQRVFPKAPLVVNTPGWITAQGLDIMTELMRVTEHTATVIIGLPSLRVTQGEREDVRRALHAAAGQAQIHELDAETPEATPSRTAAELRVMQTQSFFHLKDSSTGTARWSFHPLNSARHTPLSLSYSEASRDLIGLVSYFETPAPAYIAAWINRNVVGVCMADDDDIARRMRASARHTPEERLPYLPRCSDANLQEDGVAIPPDPQKIRLIGMAYVKSIDQDAQTVTLVSPIVAQIASALEEAGPARLFLAAGRFETPTWAYAEDSAWRRRVRRRRDDTGELGSDRMYVKQLRPGERADLVWRSGATARFSRKT